MVAKKQNLTKLTKQNKNNHSNSLLAMSSAAHLRKVFNPRSRETVDMCLEMFSCLKAERTLVIRERKFLKNKFSVINNVLCQVFVVSAKKELESCCTDV